MEGEGRRALLPGLSLQGVGKPGGSWSSVWRLWIHLGQWVPAGRSWYCGQESPRGGQTAEVWAGPW